MTGRAAALLARLLRVPTVPAAPGPAIVAAAVPALCRTYWGSHGCDLPRGVHPTHVCGSHDPNGPCSRARLADDGTAYVAWFEEDEWSVWSGGLFGEDVPA